MIDLLITGGVVAMITWVIVASIYESRGIEVEKQNRALNKALQAHVESTLKMNKNLMLLNMYMVTLREDARQDYIAVVRFLNAHRGDIPHDKLLKFVETLKIKEYRHGKT